MPEPDIIRILLVDDHGLVRRGVRRMLEDDPGISVVAEASDGHEAVQAACRMRFGVITIEPGQIHQLSRTAYRMRLKIPLSAATAGPSG